MAMDEKNGLFRFTVFRFPALAYMAFIFYMSSGPITSPTLNSFPDYDLHAAGFAALAVMVFWAMHEGLDVSRGPGGYSVPVLITVFYGISDEFHQSFVPSRDSEIKDVVADAVGALLGILLVIAMRWLISRFRRFRSA